ncbi:MAG: hypothetical protein AAF481_06285 [Acidobacteriota bacterium]
MPSQTSSAFRPLIRPVNVRAGCRVDLAGGTFDLWPIGLLHAGSRTVNLALDLVAEVELTPREAGYRIDQGEERLAADSLSELREQPGGALVATVLQDQRVGPVACRVASGSPRGGGLGASSALTVALLTACSEGLGLPRPSASEVVARGRDLEALLMGLPTGIQDHYPALLGGALEVAMVPGGHRARRLDVDLDALGESLLVAYTGQSHFSAGNNWGIVRRRMEGDEGTIRRFDGIAQVAEELTAAVEAADLPKMGELMSREWSFRRELAEGISTPTIERILKDARRAGAWGGKACGAGGGGCVAIFAPPASRGAVTEAIEAAGGKLLPARPADQGLHVSSP